MEIGGLKLSESQHEQRESALENLLTNLAATVGAVTVAYPLTNIRVRLVAQLGIESPLYEGPIDAYKKVLESEGWKGLFSGFWPTLVGAVVFETASYLGFMLIR